MNWSNRKVLVTGAGGFIGSHLCERLVQEGADVRAFVRYTSAGEPGLLTLLEKSALDQIEVVYGDLGDPDAIRKAVQGRDVIFHLGALIAIPYSYIHPNDVVRVNVNGTQNVLNAARENSVDRVVHTSTSEVYGSAQYAPIDEKHPINPQSPYAASKVGADALALSYYLSFGLPVSTIRPFNTFGPRQSGRAVIPTIIGQALMRDKIELGNLTTTRDFLFVRDTVEGFLRVASHEATLGRVTNVGTGTEISIGDITNKVLKLVNRDLPIISTEERMRPEKSEVVRLLCDADWARNNIEWNNKVDLDTGLAEVVKFIDKHRDWVDITRYEV